MIMGIMGLSLLSLSWPLNPRGEESRRRSIQPLPCPQTLFDHLLPPMPNGESRLVECPFRSLWFLVREGGPCGLSRRRFAESDDLFVLGGEPGQGLGAEVGELVDRLLQRGQPFLELGVLRLETGALGLAGVGKIRRSAAGP